MHPGMCWLRVKKEKVSEIRDSRELLEHARELCICGISAQTNCQGTG